LADSPAKMTLPSWILNSREWPSFSWSRINDVGYSVIDQALSVGGMFIANIALARAVSKEEYGMFTLVYSAFNFLAGLHNAAILEPYTVHGAGRYSAHYPEYRWIIWRSNAWLGVGLSCVLLLIWVAVLFMVPPMQSRSILGLSISSAILLTVSLARRMMYVEKKVRMAAKLSFIFFISLLGLLVMTTKTGTLNSLTVFVAVAAASIAGCVFILAELPVRKSLIHFDAARPKLWSEHWGYARWVLATAFVFQLTTQAYYWLVAIFLSLRDIAGLRAIYMLVMPVDQVFTAISLLVLPVMATRYASKQIGALLSAWKWYLLAFLLIGSSFIICVRWFGGPILHLIYGGKFDDVSYLLGTLALLPVLMGVGSTMNVVMKAAERPNIVLYAYISSGVATFGIGIPLMIHFGLRGAVYGMLISGSIYTVALGVGFLSLMPRLHALRVAANEGTSL